MFFKKATKIDEILTVALTLTLYFDIKETTFQFGYFTTISGQFFCQPHKNISRNFGADGHFEVLKMSKSQLDQKLQHKTQFFYFSFIFQFWKEKS